MMIALASNKQSYLQGRYQVICRVEVITDRHVGRVHVGAGLAAAVHAVVHAGQEVLRGMWNGEQAVAVSYPRDGHAQPAVGGLLPLVVSQPRQERVQRQLRARHRPRTARQRRHNRRRLPRHKLLLEIFS